jgi:hypothetical protein
MGMGILDRLESSVLFRLTRFLSLAVVALASLAVAGAVYAYIRVAVPLTTSVSTAEIRELMKSQPEPVLTAEPQSRIDREVSLLGSEVGHLLAELPRDEIDPAMMRVQLNSWLNELSDTDAMLDFIREMRRAIRSFKDSDKASACFAFAQAKIGKMAQEQRRRASLNATELVTLGTIGAGLLLAGVSSLVLVLLRIERNTRPSDRETVRTIPVGGS